MEGFFNVAFDIIIVGGFSLLWIAVVVDTIDHVFSRGELLDRVLSVLAGRTVSSSRGSAS